MRRAAAASAAAFSFALLAAPAHAAVDPTLVAKLATGDNDAKVEAIAQVVSTGDPEALELLRSIADGSFRHEGQEVMVNNRVRRELDSAMAALKPPDRSSYAVAGWFVRAVWRAFWGWRAIMAPARTKTSTRRTASYTNPGK